MVVLQAPSARCQSSGHGALHVAARVPGRSPTARACTVASVPGKADRRPRRRCGRHRPSQPNPTIRPPPWRRVLTCARFGRSMPSVARAPDTGMRAAARRQAHSLVAKAWREFRPVLRPRRVSARIPRGLQVPDAAAQASQRIRGDPDTDFDAGFQDHGVERRRSSVRPWSRPTRTAVTCRSVRTWWRAITSCRTARTPRCRTSARCVADPTVKNSIHRVMSIGIRRTR